MGDALYGPMPMVDIPDTKPMDVPNSVKFKKLTFARITYYFVIQHYYIHIHIWTHNYISRIYMCINFHTGNYLNLHNIAKLSAGATCSVSRERDNNMCPRAMDGMVSNGGEREWVADTTTVGQWYQVNFPAVMKVVRVDLANRCLAKRQCDRWQLTLSDGKTRLVCTQLI